METFSCTTEDIESLVSKCSSLTTDLRSLAVFARVSGYDTVLAADLEQYSSLLDFLAQDLSDRWEVPPGPPLAWVGCVWGLRECQVHARPVVRGCQTCQICLHV